MPVIPDLDFFLWQSILDCRAVEASFSFIILLKIRGRRRGVHEILSSGEKDLQLEGEESHD